VAAHLNISGGEALGVISGMCVCVHTHNTYVCTCYTMWLKYGVVVILISIYYM
jgi:hypothetical protein